MTKTTFATLEDNQAAMNAWHVVDASQHVLGRMAVRIAEVLMGKHRPDYTPHILVGEGVIVVNAGKVKLSGTKRDNRTYRFYTGYVGGLKEHTLGVLLERNPERLIKLAVRRMLPKTKLGKRMLSRLKVYSGSDHPHTAQQPTELAI